MTKSTGARVFTHLGALVYAASLVLCAYRFLVSWSIPLPPDPASTAVFGTSMRWGAVLVDVLLFSLFAVHHSLLARGSAKAIVRRFVPEPLVRSVYVWTASVLLVAALLAWQPAGGDFYRVVGWQAFVHAAVQLAGLALAVRAAAVVDPRQLAGIRPETAGRLFTSGPFRLVRHPLYLGWILMVFGAAHMTADRFVFAVVSSFYLALAIPWEERALRQNFGGDYREYMARTRWRVVPYIY